MQYMLMMYLDEQSLSEEQRQKCYLESAEFARELHDAGKYVAAAPLYPTSTATSVRVADGKRMITDGPFAETREQLGGFFVIDVDNLDEAIDIAAQVPAGQWGGVEVRPMIEVPELPERNFVRTVESSDRRSTH
jgi:hypothetical protein